MYIGVDYYPEQWPKTRWSEDVRMMKELGINVVRIAEFGWSLMEPNEGTYDFSLYDEAIDLFAKNGIDVVLGTPTATPPAWMVQRYPDILPVDENGVTISFGARRHYTVNSKTYQEFSKKIVAEMAKRYGQHAAVIGWQTDNEYGHEKSDRSYGDEDRARFQDWLKEEYGTLDKLNETWGTVFWSQTYTEWEQIPVPRKVYQEHNPSLLLDFDRFCAEAYNRYNRLQVEELKKHIDERQFITHNFVYTGLALNQKEMAKDLDFISFDNYPVWGGLPEPITPANIARQHDLCRGTKSGKGYWVMEELSGAQGWSRIGYLPRPGHLQLWTYQAISRGAEAIVYFRWRAARFGTEEFCHGILDHDGKPKRKFDEVKRVIDNMKVFGDDWIEAEYKADVAVYHDPENDWAWQIQPQSEMFNYVNEFLRFYEPAYAVNAKTDIISEVEDLDSYKVVVVPVYFLTKKGFTEKLKEYANAGGTVILTYRSGVKDEHNVVTDQTLPGDLAEIAGIEVNEYESLQSGQVNQVEGVKGSIEGIVSDATVWCDLVDPVTAEVLAEYRNTFYSGQAAITRNRTGKGSVYYIGSAVEPEILRPLYKEVLGEVGVTMVETPENVEVLFRGESGSEFMSILNHDTKAAHSFELPEGKWQDPVTGDVYDGAFTIESLGSIVLKKQQ
ncbi:beta-galactosidase [Alteribacter aurantiacus]|uniref:beta-galactosidase n=1 Tax=Alteribacter aurantiacus TaxID=254410 RepID=UPI0004177A44|nr:beta-galactosidase [Alteribacter aurantiacus]